MDILSHGLWGALAAKAFSTKTKLRARPAWGFVWGVFPDVFAFGPTFIAITIGQLTGSIGDVQFGPPEETEQLPGRTPPLFTLSHQLYNISHSFITVLLIAALVILIKKYHRKKAPWTDLVPWVLTGWLLHIITDIPTHTCRFYPTPFLWPLSDYRFCGGFSWGQPWFMMLNYGLLLAAYLYVRYRSRQ